MELKTSPVEFYEDSGAGHIVMSDSSGGNVLNDAMLRGLHAAVEAHGGDPAVRFVLLRSSNPAFSLGMDFQALSREGEGGDRDLEKSIRSYAALLAVIDALPKVTVAVVEGSVKAGGVGLAAACDVVLASRTADFELSEILWGLLPANVLPYLLSRRMSAKRAAYLVLTAAKIDADRALTLGLVDEVHPAEQMAQALRTLCRRLSRTFPRGAANYKNFVRDVLSLPFAERGERAVEELLSLLREDSVLAAVEAFQEGDLPPWFSRFDPKRPVTGG